MSVIDNTLFGTSFEPSPPFTALGNSGSGASLPAIAADNIQFAPQNPVLPITSLGGGAGLGVPSGSGGSWTFSSVMNSIGNTINNLLAQIGNTLNGSGSSSTATAPQPSAAQTFFSNATGSSNGDPHLSFDGTTSAGGTVDGTWDSMTSHGDLLSSNSFAGGYRVSTTVTQPNSKGATENATATVTAGGGTARVGMNANGSCSVTENGSAVTLQQGQATSLGNGEAVTLNADGSLTVTDQNAQGGSISTTLRSNGEGGVNVSNTASNVDLGGYLVNRSDGTWTGPMPYQNGAAEPTSALSAQMEAAYEMEQQQQLFGSSNALQPASPLQGLEQFDPESETTSLQNVELV